MRLVALLLSLAFAAESAAEDRKAKVADALGVPLTTAGVSATARRQKVSAALREPAPELKWRTDYAAAFKEARERNLPLVTLVTSANCPDCLVMEVTALADPKVKDALAKAVPLKIDGGNLANGPLLASLGVTRFPTILVAGPDGVVRERLVGKQPTDRVMAAVK